MSQEIRQNKALEMAQGQSSEFHTLWVTNELQNQNVSHSAQILDFGAGQGALLGSLQKMKYENLQGADLLAKPSGFAGNWIQSDLNRFQSEKFNSAFDCILCIEVIEHLENPREILRQFHEMLKPGGLVLMTTPHVESYRSLISLYFRGHYVDFLDNSYPAHITPVLPKDLQRIVSEAGFEKLHIQYSGKGVLPALTSLTWQQVSLGLLKGKRTSDHVMITARKKL